jgi:hypothetical protein
MTIVFSIRMDNSKSKVVKEAKVHKVANRIKDLQSLIVMMSSVTPPGCMFTLRETIKILFKL